MDITQTVLFIVIIVVSIILVVIGIQIISILKDLKLSMKRLDSILEDLEFVSRNFTRSTTTLSQLSDGLKSGIKLASMVSNLIADKRKAKR